MRACEFDLELTIRKAKAEDAPKLAELMNIAGEGLPAHLWERMAGPGEDVLAFGARLPRHRTATDRPVSPLSPRWRLGPDEEGVQAQYLTIARTRSLIGGLPRGEPHALKRIRRVGLILGTAISLVGCFVEAAGSGNATVNVRAPDGVSIAYEAAGHGAPALVFVHGWSCDRTYWEGQLQSFARDFRVVAVDLAGHGESGLGRSIQTMAAFGADVAAVVHTLELEHVVLIGHSMGGDVIVEAARQLSGRVAGLVWVDTYKQLPVLRTPEELQARLAPFRTNFAETTREMVRGMFPSNADPTLVERVAADMSAAPPDIAVGALESALRFAHEIPEALEELSLPVVAINPDNQPTDRQSMQRHGVEVVLMAGVGHFLMMEDPARFNQILKEVIDRHYGARANDMSRRTSPNG
jgi:pimeloyl-ACP methyl ester carboxylesterase